MEDYVKAERFLAQFVDRYRESDLLAEAYLWLGMSLIELARYDEALENFKIVLNEDEFDDFLNSERWEDLRFAVMEYMNDEKLLKWNLYNPAKIIFLSFLNEQRFDFTKPGWQSGILSGRIWDDILDICNSMLQWQDLGNEDVIKGIIKQGKQLTKELS